MIGNDFISTSNIRFTEIHSIRIPFEYENTLGYRLTLNLKSYPQSFV